MIEIIIEGSVWVFTFSVIFAAVMACGFIVIKAIEGLVHLFRLANYNMDAGADEHEEFEDRNG